MNTFIKLISPRNLKENTVKVYVSNLRKLATVLTGQEYVNPDFFLDSDLTEYISNLSDSKKRIILSTILLALSPSEKNTVTNPIYQDTYDKYKNNGIGNIKKTLNTDICFLCLPTIFKKNGYDLSSFIEVLGYYK